MSGTTNFLQWNPNCNNQETDAAYTADSERSAGISTSPTQFAGILANKAFYQWSTFIAAFAQMLANKGFSPNDGSAAPGSALVNLETVLANILTTADTIAVPSTVPQRVAQAHYNNQGGGIPGWTTLYNVPGGGSAYIYRLIWSAKLTAVGGGSGNTIGPLALSFTDRDNAVVTPICAAVTAPGTFVTVGSNQTLTLSSLFGIPLLIVAKPGTAIQYSFGYSWSGSGAQQFYELHLELELLEAI